MLAHHDVREDAAQEEERKAREEERKRAEEEIQELRERELQRARAEAAEALDQEQRAFAGATDSCSSWQRRSCCC